MSNKASINEEIEKLKDTIDALRTVDEVRTYFVNTAKTFTVPELKTFQPLTVILH